MDAFVVGAVVRRLSAIFDRYWNSEVVYPIEIDRRAAAATARRAGRIRRRRRIAPQAPPIELPPADVARLRARSAKSSTPADRPAVGQGPCVRRPAGQATSMRDEAAGDQRHERRDDADLAGEERARHHVALPGPGPPMAWRAFEDLRQRKVKVTLMTNSLAANDEPLVHTGYSRYRTPAAGRRRPLRAEPDAHATQQAARHVRHFARPAAREDRGHRPAHVFIGSMNLDPRSARTNTEMGMFIDSPQLAKELLRVINISRLQSAYRVRLQPKTRHSVAHDRRRERDRARRRARIERAGCAFTTSSSGCSFPSSCSRG